MERSSMHPLFAIVLRDLKIDIQQMVEEGHDLASLEKEVDAAAATDSLDVLARLQEDLWNRPSPASFAYEEPSDWDSTSREFPDADSHDRFSGDEAALADRVLGGWLGRCIGCQLGKPLEGAWPEEAKRVCQISGSWPLADYLKPIADAKQLEELGKIDGYGKRIVAAQPLTRGRFDHVVPDDDIHYSIVGQLTLEKHGVVFTTEQAMALLRATTPQSFLSAAGLNTFRASTFGLPAPYTALMGNPSRQSLGAQIRCDPFGWAAPANPALAARMAFQDARSSQVRNGLYSGVFFAVAIADAFSHGDPVRALATAERYVPPRSRFAEMIRFTRAACRDHADWQAANAAIYGRYDRDLYAPHRAPMNHSLINAAIVILAVLKGAGDFTKTAGIAAPWPDATPTATPPPPVL
jgi:hypothetical protein